MSPIDDVASLSNTGVNVVPLLTVFQTPLVARADVEDRGIALEHGEVVDASRRRRRADVAEHQPIERPVAAI